jgi:D-3-phosphoglycerate dehydrogenase/(S)-sulfolactate dehydrogenase
MPAVLVSPREVRQYEPRYADVLHAAGWTVAYPPPGEANILVGDELRAALVGVEAVMAGGEPYTAELFAQFPKLRVVARVGVGYDSVDVPAATVHGVAVTVAPGTNHESVAEHTFALMLAFTRHIPTRNALIHSGGWPQHYSRPLRGQTFGLAGLGRIGKAVAVRAVAFGMRVIAFDPLPLEMAGVERVTFDELLAQSDYLSLHLPLTAQTRHMMNTDTFARMKLGAVLVNTSRGGLVCEADLVAALRSGHLGGALLDVLEQEPPPPDHPLFGFENVILTPHAAGVDTKSLGDMARSAAEAVVAIGRGEWPTEKVVNGEVKGRFS